MIYGVENNVLESPFSLLISIILFLGVINFGNYIQKKFFKNILGLNYTGNVLFSPIVGTYILLFPIYIILIFEFYAAFFLYLISFSLLLLGLLQIFTGKLFVSNIIFLFKKKNLLILFIVLLFLCLFLISGSPITHSDSLDYHFIGALNLLKNGHFYKDIMPMHNNLVSIGEIMLALGLTLKSVEFGGILQFSSLLALIPFFWKENSKKLFLILILTCPITFFLVSSPKPQMLFCISTFLIFIFLSKIASSLTNYQLKIIFPIVILVLSINSLSKYSFLLSSILLGSFFLYIMFSKKLFIFSIISVIFVFSVTFLPFWIFRIENFQTPLINLMQSPLPINIYGYQSMHNLLSGGSISILSIFFPKNTLEFSTSYGPLIALLPFMSNIKILKFKKEISIIIIFFISVFLFGSNLPRFLFEGYLWIIYLVSININVKSICYKIFNKLIYIQFILIVPILLFFIINIFPGSLFNDYKKNVMIKNANGYELAQWTNSKLSEEDILLSTHRSISLFKNKTFSNMFTWHTNKKNKNSKIYYEFLKEEKVNRILFYGNELNKQIYSKCLGEELYYKEDVGRITGRNPMTKSPRYNAWIYELNFNQLPDCLFR